MDFIQYQFHVAVLLHFNRQMGVRRLTCPNVFWKETLSLMAKKENRKIETYSHKSWQEG